MRRRAAVALFACSLVLGSGLLAACGSSDSGGGTGGTGGDKVTTTTDPQTTQPGDAGSSDGNSGGGNSGGASDGGNQGADNSGNNPDPEGNDGTTTSVPAKASPHVPADGKSDTEDGSGSSGGM